MTMNEALSLLISGLTGVLLGTVFFGGLWWTVRWGVAATRPAAWFVTSMLLRISLALAVFYFVAVGGHWQRLLVSLLGFTLARLLVTRFTREKGGPVGLPREARDET
jgi:F1F0 ATPase subunit 2